VMGSRELGADEAFARAEEMVRVWLAEQGGGNLNEGDAALVGGSSALLHQLLRGLRAGGATEQGEKEAGISRHGGTPQGCGTL